MGRVFWIACMLVAAPAYAQESQIHAELRAEGERLAENCTAFDLAKIGSCAMTIATDRPLHFSFGSIAPQNGFGLGAAFVSHHTPNERWRLNWSADGVGAPGGAWRTGAYLKVIHTPVQAPVVVPGAGTASAPPSAANRQYPVIDVYGQVISLPTIPFFGLGPSTTREDKSTFGFRETIAGAKALVPMSRFQPHQQINLSLLGEVNARFVRLQRIEPSSQPVFLQFAEGVRIRPATSNGVLRLTYLAQVEHFVAPNDSSASFRRFTIDLGHDVALYHNSPARQPRDSNGPNDCSIDPATDGCPSISRNRTGSVGFRLLLSRSHVNGDSIVPFYFQQTLGGSDINGTTMLAGYDDYRFRGPHMWLLQETFEHSIYGPVGVWLAAEQGKVALQGGDLLSSRDFVRSLAAGVSVRAGGFPAVVISLAKGTEGYHFAATISPTLLGGSSRPSLH